MAVAVLFLDTSFRYKQYKQGVMTSLHWQTCHAHCTLDKKDYVGMLHSILGDIIFYQDGLTLGLALYFW